jgi:transcriptional regulator with XRE-family HTH domain
MSISKSQLGQAVRQIRELRGYSQAELGHKSGLQPNTIALIERGERGVSLDALNKVANALAIPAGCLTMLGTTKIKGDSESTAMVKSMQELILAAVIAQSQLQGKEKAAQLNQAKVEANRSSPRSKALVRKSVGRKKVSKADRSLRAKKAATSARSSTTKA